MSQSWSNWLDWRTHSKQWMDPQPSRVSQETPVLFPLGNPAWTRFCRSPTTVSIRRSPTQRAMLLPAVFLRPPWLYRKRNWRRVSTTGFWWRTSNCGSFLSWKTMFRNSRTRKRTCEWRPNACLFPNSPGIIDSAKVVPNDLCGQLSVVRAHIEHTYHSERRTAEDGRSLERNLYCSGSMRRYPKGTWILSEKH